MALENYHNETNNHEVMKITTVSLNNMLKIQTKEISNEEKSKTNEAKWYIIQP